MFLTPALLSRVFPLQGLVNILMERRRAFVSSAAVSLLLNLPWSEGRATADWWKCTTVSLGVSSLSSGVYSGLMGCFCCFRQPSVSRSAPSFWWHLNKSCLGYASTTATVRRFSETSSECLCGMWRNVRAGFLVKANGCHPSPYPFAGGDSDSSTVSRIMTCSLQRGRKGLLLCGACRGLRAALLFFRRGELGR